MGEGEGLKGKIAPFFLLPTQYRGGGHWAPAAQGTAAAGVRGKEGGGHGELIPLPNFRGGAPQGGV